MRTEDFVLLGAFAAVIIFGYYIMLRLDHFLDKIRRKNEEQEPTSCLHIVLHVLTQYRLFQMF